MKKYIIIVLLLVWPFTFKTNAQVGVGTLSPNSSASLDVDVTSLPSTAKKGILLPKVQLLNNTDVTTVPNPAVGLMVFNLEDRELETPQAVEANTYYYWNGVEWANLSSLSEVRRELLPQVFFVAEGNGTGTTPQNTVSDPDDVNVNVNVAPVVVKFSPSSVILNTGNNVTLNSNNTFTINNTGSYEVSGFINYNPSISLTLGVSNTNVEFIIQSASDVDGPWTAIAKTIGVWGAGSTVNNKSNNIPPVTISVTAGTLLRCVVVKTDGMNHGGGAQISSPTGLKYGKVIKIQKVD